MAERRAQRSSKKEQKPSPSVKWLFLAATIFMIAVSVALSWLYAANTSEKSYLFIGSIALSLFFPLVAISYMVAKGQNLKGIIRSLGLSRDRLTWDSISMGLLLFLMLLLIELAIGVFSKVTNIPLPTNVDMLLSGSPLYFLAFAFIVAPIDEEMLFRGFLVPRIGIVLSAVIFALLHALSYLSISEFAAALAFGLIAGYMFRRTKSLYTTIIGHALVNLVAVFALVYFIHI